MHLHVPYGLVEVMPLQMCGMADLTLKSPLIQDHFRFRLPVCTLPLIGMQMP